MNHLKIKETPVSMRHFVFVTLCGWLSGMHTRQSSTQSDKYQVSHRYSYFSWWWAHSCLKHVQKRNKHAKKNCALSWLYLQDYTGVHGQQHIKFYSIPPVKSGVDRDSCLQHPLQFIMHYYFSFSSTYIFQFFFVVSLNTGLFVSPWNILKIRNK